MTRIPSERHIRTVQARLERRCLAVIAIVTIWFAAIVIGHCLFGSW
jgi:hypothetical protein